MGIRRNHNVGVPMSSFRQISFLIILLVATFSITFGQNILNQTGYNRIGSAFWSSGGAGIAEPGVPGAALSNPSLLSLTAMAVSLEFGWRPATQYAYSFDYDKTVLVPSFASVGIPISGGAIEVGYARTYDERFESEPIPITTASQPDGTGQYIRFLNSATTHTGYAAISKSFGESISLGLEAGVDFVRYEASSTLKLTATGERMRFSAGMLGRISEQLRIGVAVHVAQDIHLKSTQGPTVLPLIQDSSSVRPVGTYQRQLPSFSAKTPPRAEIGLSYDISTSVRLLGAAEYEYWSSKGPYIDLWQYRAGLAASVLPDITVRAGFFTLRSPNAYMKDYLDESFLTAGGSWRVTDNITFSVAYQTSSLFTKTPAAYPLVSEKHSLDQQMLSGGISFTW